MAHSARKSLSFNDLPKEDQDEVLRLYERYIESATGALDQPTEMSSPIRTPRHQGAGATGPLLKSLVQDMRASRSLKRLKRNVLRLKRERGYEAIDWASFPGFYAAE